MPRPAIVGEGHTWCDEEEGGKSALHMIHTTIGVAYMGVDRYHSKAAMFREY